MKVLLLKRLESSIFAFKSTVEKLLTIHELFYQSLERGIIPAGEEASELLYDAESYDEEILLENLAQFSARYDAQAFKIDALKREINHDIRILQEIHNAVGVIDPEKDDKQKTLQHLLSKPPLNHAKVLIFTQYADTAEYLYEYLKDADACVFV